MAEYEDGTRDCPRCLDIDKPNPNRVRGDGLAFCTPCDHAIHVEALSVVGELDPLLRRQLAFTDWLIEHGRYAA